MQDNMQATTANKNICSFYKKWCAAKHIFSPCLSLQWFVDTVVLKTFRSGRTSEKSPNVKLIMQTVHLCFTVLLCGWYDVMSHRPAHAHTHIFVGFTSMWFGSTRISEVMDEWLRSWCEQVGVCEGVTHWAARRGRRSFKGCTGQNQTRI